MPSFENLLTKSKLNSLTQAPLVKHFHRLIQWVTLGTIVGFFCGIASALFLFLIDNANQFRLQHAIIIFSLPLAGFIIGLVYDRWGKQVIKGNNLIIDTMHSGGNKIPIRMVPMVLIGAILTDLFGGSAGREGAAVQMGAAIADEISHRLRVKKETRIQLLAAGIAGGFGSVFGTPIAGTLFGLEVVCIGKIEYDALLPALIAAIIGSFTTKLFITHPSYPKIAALNLSLVVFGKLLLFGLIIALASIVFVDLTHGINKFLESRLKSLSLKMMFGGLAIMALWQLIGTSDYLGLGIPIIIRSFSDPKLVWYAFALKLIFTAITLGCGYLGGEVTPLFFIGAALGNIFGRLLGLPIALSAGIGLAAMFAASANTPISLSIMAVEILGVNIFPHVVIVSVVAYLLTGHRGVYPSQKLLKRKTGEIIEEIPPIIIKKPLPENPL
jgi:H+/Cl- antiporter ClcA